MRSLSGLLGGGRAHPVDRRNEVALKTLTLNEIDPADGMESLTVHQTRPVTSPITDQWIDTMTTDILFVDSHGGLWAVCGADEPGAEAFGPYWAARSLPWSRLGLRDFTHALIEGMIDDHEDGWTYVMV